MNSLQFPVATQDWTLAARRALSLQAAQVRSVTALSGALWVTVSGSSQDFFVSSGEALNIPCQHGQVVIEALGNNAVVRIGQQADALRRNEHTQSFAHAVYVSVVCPVVRGLRKTADWLDPSAPAARAG